MDKIRSTDFVFQSEANPEMPTISRFFGITIRMYYEDHLPPHFHAYYAEFGASVAIDSLLVLDGHLPPRALKLVSVWAISHHTELHVDWLRTQDHQPLYQIEPLR